jgi:hypothetical protein
MKAEIFEAISDVSPYSEAELDRAYNYVNSFDLVVAAVGVAMRFNVSLDEACKIVGGDG